MEKIKFEDGQLVRPAYVTIDNVEHEVTSAVYEGNTPLSSYNLNRMQNEILEDGIIVSPTEPTTDRRKVWFQKGKNLFDGQIINGYGLNEDGTTYVSSHRAVSDFISIIANSNYCFSGAEFKTICIFDKDKNFISSLNGSSANNFSTPSNAKYVRLAFDNTVDYSNLQVEYGTEATEFEEYVNPAIYIKNEDGIYEEFIKKEEIVTTKWQALALNLNYRKVVKNIELAVNYNPSAETVNGGWITLGTLPEDYRPTTEVLTFPVLLRNLSNSQYLVGAGQILRNGTIRINQRTGSAVTIDNVMFAITYSTAES